MGKLFLKVFIMVGVNKPSHSHFWWTVIWKEFNTFTRSGLLSTIKSILFWIDIYTLLAL